MIIGLAGYSKAGKTSIAQAIAKVNKYPIHSFAAALKARVDPLFPPKTSKEIKRPTYVEYGRGMRAVEADHWIKELSRKLILSEPTCIIDDCRYLNELRWIESKGGVVFYLSRKGIGPANDEERDSFAEIFAAVPNLPTIDNNTTVERAAADIFGAMAAGVAA